MGIPESVLSNLCHLPGDLFILDIGMLIKYEENVKEIAGGAGTDYVGHLDQINS